MTGRGTRGYVALDAGSGALVWLKDTWRVDYEGVEREGDILGRLNEARIVNAPMLVCHGDVLDQTTQTPRLWERATWRRRLRPEYPHFRRVLQRCIFLAVHQRP